MDYTTKSLNFQRMRIVWWLPTKKLTSELFIVRNVNQSLQNRIINLEKQQFTQNNTTDVEISGISNEVSDRNLEQTITGICRDSGIDINPLDIDGCHRLQPERNAINTTKQLIMKFVNRKHSKLFFSIKRTLTRKVRCFLAIHCVPIIDY